MTSNSNSNSNISSNSNNNNDIQQQFKSDFPILIPYQIDFQTRTIGKHISLTKRFYVWKFGFAHVSQVKSSHKKSICSDEYDFGLGWLIEN